jgi:TolB protein
LYQQAENGQWDIWVMNTDGTDKFKVTLGTGDKTDAVFTFDGQFIIYSSDVESEIANIYKIPVIGGNPEQLTFYNGYDGAPSVSSDGTKIVFESAEGYPEESSGTKLFIMEL